MFCEENPSIRSMKILFYNFSYLCHTFGASPVAFGRISQWGQQTVGVVVVVTAITQQELLVVISSTAHSTHE